MGFSDTLPPGSGRPVLAKEVAECDGVKFQSAAAVRHDMRDAVGVAF